MLMAAIMALFGVVGGMLGGGQGMLFALLIGLGTNLWAYWFSDSMVLRMYNAQEVDAASAPQVYGIVEELVKNAGLPMPRVYVIDEPQPNAFATGRNPDHAAVAVTTGILQLLSTRELRGVLGHELTHVKNRDILTSTITASIAGAISSLGWFLTGFGRRDGEGGGFNPIASIVVLILAPIAAMLLRMSLSRRREYLADATAAEITNDPEGMAMALRRLTITTARATSATACPHFQPCATRSKRLGSNRTAALLSTCGEPW
jgi:heat shock protein HtpX